MLTYNNISRFILKQNKPHSDSQTTMSLTEFHEEKSKCISSSDSEKKKNIYKNLENRSSLSSKLFRLKIKTLKQ